MLLDEIARKGALRMLMEALNDFVVEQELWCRGLAAVAGVDEVVVRALAGPLVLPGF